MRRTTLVTFFILTVGAAGASRGAAAAGPGVSVAPSAITATGITPGAQVLFFGAGFEPKTYYAVVHRWSTVVADADMDGSVSYALDSPVTWNALWIVADLRTGRYAVASTPGFPVHRSALERRDFKRDMTGGISRFVYSRSIVDFLYVSPGGAWTLQARDGESTDGDSKVDGETAIDLSRLRPLLSGADVPRAFTPGGTLFIIDSSRLDLLELKIDASILAGAR
ncbi:MAG: hypothetical protein AABO58_09125 [Acidobacteriota bacterium]